MSRPERARRRARRGREHQRHLQRLGSARPYENELRGARQGRVISRRDLVFGWRPRTRTIKQPFASTERLRGGGPILTTVLRPCSGSGPRHLGSLSAALRAYAAGPGASLSTQTRHLHSRPPLPSRAAIGTGGSLAGARVHGISRHRNGQYHGQSARDGQHQLGISRDDAGLENRCRLIPTVGSNPTLSARNHGNQQLSTARVPSPGRARAGCPCPNPARPPQPACNPLRGLRGGAHARLRRVEQRGLAGRPLRS